LYLTKQKRNETIREIINESNDIESNFIINADKAYENGDYAYMLIMLYNIIENKIFTKLAEKRNLDRNLLNPNSIIEIASKDGILTPNQLRLIYEIRSLRNKAAHGMLEIPLDKNYARELLEKTKNLFSIMTFNS
jgi:hypothetical protein